MQAKHYLTAAVCTLLTASAHAQITAAVMTVTGAEMH